MKDTFARRWMSEQGEMAIDNTLSGTTVSISEMHNDHCLLPNGWLWVRLGDVCESHTGTRDPGSEPDKPFRYVDISSVDNDAKRIVMPRSLLGKKLQVARAK